MLREKGCDLYIGIIGKFTNAIKPKDERNPPILSSKYLKFLVLDDIPDKSFPEISEIIKVNLFIFVYNLQFSLKFSQ